jgi:hypothetical protein
MAEVTVAACSSAIRQPRGEIERAGDGQGSGQKLSREQENSLSDNGLFNPNQD